MIAPAANGSVPDVDVLIVGAGPAGLAAAAALVQAGVAVTIVDDNDQAGGQYFRQLPAAFRVDADARLTRDQERALAALAVLDHPLVTYLPDTILWAMPEERVFSYVRAGSGGRMRARAVILATGAYDRPNPFPGWTLPGVLSAGGCLNLIKGQGMVPGRRVAIVGNGPLLLVAAYSLLRAGVEVVAVAEAATTSGMLRGTAGLIWSPKLLWLGLRYRAAMLAAGVPLLSGHAVVVATGEGRVEQVVIAPVDAQGAPRHEQARTFSVDTLVTGYGLAPSTEIARMIGCTMQHDALLGGWVPLRSARLETSIPAIYAAGDGAGIGGVELALAEGRLAGVAVAVQLTAQAAAAIAPAQRKLIRLNRFRRALSAAYDLPQALTLATDDTIICRCEDVTQGEIRKAARACDGDFWRTKSTTRVSMGRCQGRNCLASCASIIARECHLPATALEPPRMRPPARPIPIASLLDETLGPAREPDMPAR
jgi:NADPH-dependent 2,4-dienoyl-CoA reductase/sulfur reductase-like enzyme